MIRYKASEIITSALKLAQLNNSNMFTTRDFVEILNAQYRVLFNLMVDAGDGYYIKTILSDDFVSVRTPQYVTMQLPRDFYQLTFVGEYNALSPSSSRRIERIPTSSAGNGYEFENKELRITTNYEEPFIIKYIPVPKTITTPAPTLTLPNIKATDVYCAKHNGFWTDNGFYSLETQIETTWEDFGIVVEQYKALNELILTQSGFFRLLTGGISPLLSKISDITVDQVTNIAFPDGTLFADGKIDNKYEFPLADFVYKYAFDYLEIRDNEIYWNGLNYTSHFLEEDTLDDYDKWIVSGNFLVLLKDHRLTVYNGLQKYHTDDDAEDAIQDVTDNLCSVSTSDSTLYGIHVNNFQLKSFVPDTIFDYPNNIFYDLLISRCAGQMLLTAKQDPQNAVLLSGQLETQLLKMIRRDAFQMTTINNSYTRRGMR